MINTRGKHSYTYTQIMFTKRFRKIYEHLDNVYTSCIYQCHPICQSGDTVSFVFPYFNRDTSIIPFQSVRASFCRVSGSSVARADKLQQNWNWTRSCSGSTKDKVYNRTDNHCNSFKISRWNSFNAQVAAILAAQLWQCIF